MFIYTLAYNASINTNTLYHHLYKKVIYGKITASISTIIYHHEMEKKVFLMVTLCCMCTEYKSCKRDVAWNNVLPILPLKRKILHYGSSIPLLLSADRMFIHICRNVNLIFYCKNFPY